MPRALATAKRDVKKVYYEKLSAARPHNGLRIMLIVGESTTLRPFCFCSREIAWLYRYVAVVFHVDAASTGAGKVVT